MLRVLALEGLVHELRVAQDLVVKDILVVLLEIPMILHGLVVVNPVRLALWLDLGGRHDGGEYNLWGGGVFTGCREVQSNKTKRQENPARSRKG